MENQQEIWKAVIGYESYYEVSSFGRVKRIKSKNRPIEKIRKIQYKKNGYAVIMISIAQKFKLAHIHRLVAMAFIPNPDNKPQVNHKDMDKTNNHLENLEWCTHQENMAHAIKNKKWSNNAKYGKENARSRKIIQYNKNGDKVKEWDNISRASEKMNISPGEITICCQGKRKSAGGFQWRYFPNTDKLPPIDYGLKKVKKMTMEGEEIDLYDNCFLASKLNNLSSAGIWNVCNGKSNHCGGYKWEYFR